MTASGLPQTAAFDEDRFNELVRQARRWSHRTGALSIALAVASFVVGAAILVTAFMNHLH
jgi:hypothetical protein